MCAYVTYVNPIENEMCLDASGNVLENFKIISGCSIKFGDYEYKTIFREDPRIIIERELQKGENCNMELVKEQMELYKKDITPTDNNTNTKPIESNCLCDTLTENTNSESDSDENNDENNKNKKKSSNAIRKESRKRNKRKNKH